VVVELQDNLEAASMKIQPTESSESIIFVSMHCRHFDYAHRGFGNLVADYLGAGHFSVLAEEEL
jgi:hypothetical protein